MEINFTLNAEDIVTFQRYHIKRRIRRTLKLRILLAFLLLLVLIPFWIPVLVDPAESLRPADPLPAVLMTVIVIVLLLVLLGQSHLLAWGMAKQSRQAVTKFDHRMMLSPKRITLTSDAMQFESAFWNATYRWAGIAEVALTPDHLFIYIVSNFAHVIPMRAFTGEKSFWDFAQAAKEYKKLADEKEKRIPVGSARTGSRDWRLESDKQFQSLPHEERKRADEWRAEPPPPSKEGH